MILLYADVSNIWNKKDSAGNINGWHYSIIEFFTPMLIISRWKVFQKAEIPILLIKRYNSKEFSKDLNAVK